MSISIQISSGTQAYMNLLEIEDLTFTEDELKTKYRQAAMKHHPDQGGESRVFMKVKEAYDALKIFASVSIDKRGSINISEKKAEILKPGYIWDDCPSCEGSGFLFGRSFAIQETCANCEGTGYYKLKCGPCQGTGTFKLRSGREVQCRECAGTGVRRRVYCNVCNTKELKKLRRGFWGDSVPPIGKVEKIVKGGKHPCSRCEGTGKYQREQINPVIRSGSLRQ